MANTHFFSVLVPGALLLVLGAGLVSVAPDAAVIIALLGLLLLVAWPAFTIGVEVRCARRRKRGVAISARLARTQRVIAASQAATMLVVLPTAVLGGLGAYCLLTVDADPDQRVFKIAVGSGPLLLAAVPLLFFAHGRSHFMLRLAGVAVTLFGVGGLGAGAFVGLDGTSLTMLLTSVVMIAAGRWLAVTGRNRLRRG